MSRAGTSPIDPLLRPGSPRSRSHPASSRRSPGGWQRTAGAWWSKGRGARAADGEPTPAPSALELGLVAVTAGAALLVGRAGQPGWQVVRVGAVLVAGALAVTTVRRGGWWAAVLAWAVGVIGTAVGLGVGGPHLAKAGGLVPIVAAAACLAGGAVLLATGVGRAVRAVPGWWRLAVAPVVAVPTLVLLATTTIAVAATNVPPSPLGDRTPADVGLAYEDVAVPTADGPVLSGWYVPSRSGAAVVLLHGSGSTRSAVLDHAAVLARHGYGALLLDARGHGRSEGTAMDLGWWGDSDVAAAVTFLRSQPDVDDARIGAVGLSMGGEEALGALGADPRLRAVVAEGATGRVAGDDAWLVDVHGWRGSAQGVISRVRDATIDVLTDATAPASLRTAVTAAAPRRALVIAGGDTVDEADVARDLERTAPDVVDVWVVPETGHTAGLDSHPEEWERRVVAFLDAQLGG